MSKEKLDTKKTIGERRASKKASAERFTVGFLCERLVDDYSIRVWDGVRDAAEELGVNLICFSGGILRDPLGFRSQANILYSLVSEESVDGLVFWGAQLVHYTTPQDLRLICDRYSLPIVNIGLVMEGIPGLLVDNYQGMRDIVAHLIETHGCQRIAYIGGPGDTAEVKDRYRGYVEALATHRIPLDPSLVVLWNKSMDEALQESIEAGEAGVNILLDERELQPRKDFDALVGHDDGMTRWMLNALQTRGFEVPVDLAVASFDDIPYARYLTPPLTTVRQSFYEMGRRAVELLLAHLRGGELVERVVLPMEVVIRRSCGCFDPAVLEEGMESEVPDRVTSQENLRDVLADEREVVVAEMARGLDGYAGASLWMEQVFDGFVAALVPNETEESSNVFLQDLTDVLSQVLEVDSGALKDLGREAVAWQKALSVLRLRLRPYLDKDASLRAESLWQQARVLVGEMAQQVHAYREQQTEQRAVVLRGVGQALLTAFELKELMDVLAAGLSRLGIAECYLALYENPQPYEYPQMAPEWSRLVLAYRENERVGLSDEGRRFRSQQLMPEDLWPQGRQYSFVVEPLHFRDRQIGFALFGVGPRDGAIYEMFKGDLSSALHGGLLFQAREETEKKLREAYAEVEKQVAERTAELQQEMAGRERAQAENLRLQLEVIEVQKRAIQELSTPIIPVMERVIVMPLIGAIDTLRARDVTRKLLEGIREHRARVVILDITGVPIVDSGVAVYLNKTIQAARLKGAQTIVTGVSDAVAETVVDLGIDWSGIETLADLQTGLRIVLSQLNRRRQRGGRGGME